ncbi:hypothetical protein [Bacteroides cellulosilyticus]|uniref:Uncharacterized protein n=1 Tax=Bacteroides cellulosilyticus TaxID=246787 RepID=A0A642PUM0_9BACE|nr:hypothetical protein [Bacteroides cellulosilyticus]KAA5416004.1 hypothetical protein F2Y81_16710 [Bacteroides cellulosilyticus]
MAQLTKLLIKKDIMALTSFIDFIDKCTKGEYNFIVVFIAGIVFISFLISRIILDWKMFKKQTRFSKLHEKKCESAGILFSKVQKMKWAVGNYISSYEVRYEGEHPEKKLRDSYQAFWEAYEYFQCNIIYFEPKLCAEINSFLEGIRGNVDKYSMLKEEYEVVKNHALSQEMRSLVAKSDSMLEKISEELESKFRKIIGNQ